MTYKKEIIIDGVDVSECEYYGSQNNCIVYRNQLCNKFSNCYYKQLKCKEQELKNICEAFDIEYAIDEETGNLIGRCNKLYKKEQECKELRRKLDYYIIKTIRLLDEIDILKGINNHE